MLKRLKFKLAIILLSWLPEDVWIGRYQGGYTQEIRWIAGKLDNRGVLQGLEIEKIF